MAGAAAGLLGEPLKEMMNKATEYDKTNFLVIPLGVRDNGKLTYIRIPQDETGRFFGALTWKIANAISGDLKKPEQLFSLGAGYIPSVTPMWEVAGAWLNYAQGRNPYDSYRGRQVVDDLTWRAGGLPVFQKLIQYTTNQLGFSQFSTYSDETDTTFDLIIKMTPVINRALRSTDYGETEIDQLIKKKLSSEDAQRLLKERGLLDTAIEKIRKNPDNEKEIFNDLLLEVVGEAPYKGSRKAKKTNLEKKLNVGVLKGTVSRELDALIEANTNEYRIRLLTMYNQNMSSGGFRDLVKIAFDNKIISENVVKELRKLDLL